MKTNALRNILLIILLTLAGITKLYSQNSNISKGYLSYFGSDSTNINIMSTPCYGGDAWYNMTCTIYNEDTIRINGNLYYYREPQGTVHPSHPKLDYYFPLYDTLFVREDIATGRLYRYYRDFLGTGESEKLVCDMTLEMGDEFMIYTCHPEGEESFTVVDISYNNDVKTIRLYNGWDVVYFTEGVLPRISPLYLEPGLWTNMIFESELLCEHKDGVQVYVNGQWGCYGSHPWNVDETAEKPLAVYPSIIDGSDIIMIESLYKVNNVIIVDMHGRKTKTNACQTNDDVWQINLSNSHQGGVYFIIVQTENGDFYEKIIVCN